MPTDRALALLVVLASGHPCFAQIGGDGHDGPFTPSANTVLDTTRNGGRYDFTRISIPSGVMVTLSGPNPARLYSQGPVDIDGELSAAGQSLGFNSNSTPGRGGPGGFGGGQGGLSFGSRWYRADGQGPGAGGGANPQIAHPTGGGGGAGHAAAGQPGSSPWGGGPGGAAYGSALPFDPLGGSGGGGGFEVGRGGQYCGAGGGGVLVIFADGPVHVTGTVSARGGDAEFLPSGSAVSGPFGGGGSGGSILLRSLAGVQVGPSGRVTAIGGVGTNLLFGGLRIPSGGDGFVRLDWYGAPPDVQGTVEPAPALVQQPDLRALTPLRLGQLFRLASAAVHGDIVLFLVSDAAANLLVPPFGVLRIDPLSFAFLYLGSDLVPAGLDPLAQFATTVPNEPQLAGSQLHFQALNIYSVNGRPLFTNDVVATIAQ